MESTNTTQPGGLLARLVSLGIAVGTTLLTIYIFLLYLGQGSLSGMLGGILPAIAASSGGPGGGPSGLLVVGRDIFFDQTTLTTAANQPVQVTLRNAGALQHSLIFDLGTTGSPSDDVGVPADWANGVGIAGGTSASLTLPALPAGTYNYYCNVPGHQAVMRGVLTVQ
jgi:plastocyanin